MRLVVTGASGFVGRGLLPALAASGHVGIATGRKPPTGLPDGWIGRPRCEVLCDTKLTDQIDAIIHLEVKQHVSRPHAQDLAAFERVNVAGTQTWAEWATSHAVNRFILVSTIKAAGGGPGVHREGDPIAPDTAYGRSKAGGEDVVRAWANVAGTTASILRSAPVYGPGNEANLATFVQQIKRGRPCYIADGATRKSLVARRNLVAAIQFALDRINPGCEVFNVADAETITVRELALLIAELGRFPKPRGVSAVAARALAIIGDLVEGLTGQGFPLTSARLWALREETVFPCDKLVAAGYRHPQTLREGIAEMLAPT